MQSRIKPKSLNSWKNVRRLYGPFYPKILKDNNGFRYNLNEDNIFGNLYYSMNQDFLKGKMANLSKIPINEELRGVQKKPMKLIPILRYKKK